MTVLMAIGLLIFRASFSQKNWAQCYKFENFLPRFLSKEVGILDSKLMDIHDELAPLIKPVDTASHLYVHMLCIL
jgi:hypothetical protein